MSYHLHLYLLTRLDMPYTLHSTMLVSVCYHVLYTPSNLTSYIFQGVQICHPVSCSSPCCCKCILYTPVLDVTIAVSGVGEEVGVGSRGISGTFVQKVDLTTYKQRVFSLPSVYIRKMSAYLTILLVLRSLAGSLLVSLNRRSHVRCGHSAQITDYWISINCDLCFQTHVYYLPTFSRIITSVMLEYCVCIC